MKTLPPFVFEEVVNGLSLDLNLKESILSLLTKKREASEISVVQEDLKLIQLFIDECLNSKEAQLKTLANKKPTQKHYDIFDFTIHQIITKK